MTQKKKKDVVRKKSKKIAMACPQCMDKQYPQYPENTDMKEEMVNGIIAKYSCPRCGYQVEAE